MQKPERDEALALMEEQIPRLRRFARYLSRDPVYADDLVQDCLLRAVENIEKWTPGTNMRAWLLVILRNVFLNAKRKAKRELPSTGLVEEKLAVAVPGAQEARAALLEVRDAFFKLSEQHREVLLLVAMEGLQYEEASVVLEVPVGTVRSRLSRARQALYETVEAGRSPPVATLTEERGG